MLPYNEANHAPPLSLRHVARPRDRWPRKARTNLGEIVERSEGLSVRKKRGGGGGDIEF